MVALTPRAFDSAQTFPDWEICDSHPGSVCYLNFQSVSASFLLDLKNIIFVALKRLNLLRIFSRTYRHQ